MEKIRIAVIGYGQRGDNMTNGILLKIDAYNVVAVCDEYQDRVDKAIDDVVKATGKAPFGTTDYREILKADYVDAVYVATSWETHVEVAIEAMRAGKAVALEVGGAYSIDELWELVRTYEEVRVPFMLMENCCFNKSELLVTSVVRKGLLGTIVHCDGSYAHDLRSEICRGNLIRHYRLRNYRTRNAENYPTHELGPIAKLLNINRGNRMLSLVSVASKACGLEEYVLDHPELVAEDPTLQGMRFKQGDIVNTVITCAGGETIHLRLDTTLPRYYSRNFNVRGTKGSYFQDFNGFMFDGEDDESMNSISHISRMLNNGENYKQYLPKEWRDITPEDIKAGHGGMDIIEFRKFAEYILEGKESPIDVYDAATWMCITALSEQSIAQGGAPQNIPDFTHGMWTRRKPLDVVDFD